jgi:hypothetical protein
MVNNWEEWYESVKSLDKYDVIEKTKEWFGIWQTKYEDKMKFEKLFFDELNAIKQQKRN